jgi:YHS domain-containing protein
MCHYSFVSRDATHKVIYGGKEYHVCQEHFDNPISDPRAQVIDFQSDKNHYGGSTSAEAAQEAAQKAKLNDTHFRILGRLCWFPQTPDEIAISMQLNWSTARARMTDLKNAGLITSTGETRTAQGGKPANVMRATSPEEREQEQAA